MLKVSNACRVEIGVGDTFRMKRPEGRTVEVHAGKVWITLDNDPRDLVLGAGETVRIDGRRDMLVSGLRAGAFSITQQACGCAA